MTSITITESETENELTVKGHAGHGENGKDIVCAGISALAFSYIWAIDAEERCGQNVDISIHEADIHVRVENPTEGNRACFNMLKKGLEAIANEYSENIFIKNIKK